MHTGAVPGGAPAAPFPGKGRDMSRHTIRKGDLEATVESHGAQLVSLKRVGHEYLWQGDPAWWAGQAPILFPIVGVLRADKAVSEQGPIELKRHGLARLYEHVLLSQSESEVVFELLANEEMLGRYPYPFALRMSYRLVDEGLIQVFEVENTGTAAMPFVVGGHPAFNVPIPGFKGSFEDHVLKFSRPWTSATPWVDTQSGLIDYAHSTQLVEDSDTLPLSRDLFEHDTCVLEDVPDSTVSLVGPQGHGVRLDFAGLPFLGIWSPSDAPFVALEPWAGIATRFDEDDVFERKRNMQFAEPGETKRYSFSIMPF